MARALGGRTRPDTESKAVQENHRVRVGRQRRARTRRLLLDSVMHVCSSEDSRAPAVIDQIIRHAGVSRGTFYKYFSSIDEAISALGAEMADEMTAGISSVYDVLEDPIMRTATGFQLFLARSIIEPGWGAFIVRIGVLRDDDLFTQKIRYDIALGVESGDYFVEDINCASDMLMGATVEAILRLNKDGPSIEYIKCMARMVLGSFGVNQSKARKVVDRSFDRLVSEAQNKLHWWNKPELFK